MSESTEQSNTATATALVLSEHGSGDIVRRTWHITVSQGPDEGKSIVRESGTLLVGTSPDCDLVLTDPTISRRHATLELHSEGVVVADRGSRNGVHIGRARVDRAFVVPGGTVTLGRTQLRFEGRDAKVQVAAGGDFGEFLTSQAELQKTIARLRIVSTTNVTVLIQGEPGVGKRLLARMIHQHSPRAANPFISVDCDAVPAAELPGHLFGADGKPGAFERANNGTVVLASAADLPLEVQARVLELIETRTLRVGESGRPRPVDIRFIFTDHRDLAALTDSREFREDLYYRVAVVLAAIPPLRERPGDIVQLAEHFARRIASSGIIDQSVVELLVRYNWPGNVRELSSVIERASAGEGPEPVDRRALARQLRVNPMPFHEGKEQVVAEFERRYVRTMLAMNADNISGAARDAGLSRGAFYALMRRGGVDLSSRPGHESAPADEGANGG